MVRPTATTLRAIADALGVELVDLVIEPTRSARERLIDATRHLDADELAELLERLDSE